MKKIHNPLKWVIWTLAAIFYFYEFFLRVAPSVMVGTLMEAFDTNAAAIGWVSAAYYYAYGPLQIPVGMLTDRYGARRLLAGAALIAGLGTLLFALSSGVFLAFVGRLFMGAGSAFGFVGLVYICSHWFPPKQRGIMIGLGNTVGMLGAIMGQGPLRSGIDLFGWKITTFGLAAFGIALALIIYLFIRNDPIELQTHHPIEPQKTESIWKSLRSVVRNRLSWINAIMASLFYVATPSFAGLWGIPFLHNVYDIPVEIAGFVTSMVFVGWAIGGPVWGGIVDRLGGKKGILLLTTFIGGVLMSIVIFVPNIPILLIGALLFFLGLVSSAELLNFGYSIDINPPEAKGTATAFTNLVIIMASAIVQPFLGYLLGRNVPDHLEEGLHVFSRGDFITAMSFFPAAFFAAFILGCFLKKVQKA